MPLTACRCLGCSGDRIGDDDDEYGDNDNNNNYDNDNRLSNFLGHITHISSNLHETQFVTFLLQA